MPASLTIAIRNLKQRLRDRSAILFAVVVPLGLATAFSLLLPSGAATFHTSYRVHDADGGPAARILVDDVLGSLVEHGIADVTPAGSEAEAVAAVDANDVAAAILIPSGLSDSIAAGRPATIRIVAVPGNEISVQLATSAIGGFASGVDTLQLSVVTSLDLPPGASPPPIDPATIAAVSSLPDPITIATTAAIQRKADSATFYAASMAMMFLFFATVYGPLGLLGERRTGTLARLLAAPIRPASIVVGASVTAFVMGIVSMTVLVIATTLLLGASWGPPLFVALLVLSAVTAAMGVSTLVCTLARTEEQAGGWNAMIAISLAILGGAMIPLSQAPELLTQLSRLTPHAWFLLAIDTMSGPAVELADILPSVIVLVAFGVVTGAIGLARARTALVTR